VNYLTISKIATKTAELKKTEKVQNNISIKLKDIEKDMGDGKWREIKIRNDNERH